MTTIIKYDENRCQLGCRWPPWDHVDVSNRRRTPADRSHPHGGSHHPQTAPSRPFGGRGRVHERSYAALTRLHAMPRWTVPVATVVLVFVGLYAGPVLGGICLLVVAAFLGWLAYLAWPKLGSGGRVGRCLVLGLLAGFALARLTGLWG
jgi:hypothetical protein